MKKIILILAALISGLAYADNLADAELTTFAAGSAARAAEVNGNFDAVQAAINDNDARITALQSTGADITAVTAGSGLTGGGAAGAVTLSVGTGAITSAMIADGSIIGIDIAAGAVTSSRIATDTIIASNIAAGAVGTSEIADGSIAQADLSSALTAMINNVGLDYITSLTMINISGLDNTTFNNSGSVSVTCPSSGYVLVTASGTSTFFGDGRTVDVGIGNTTTAFLNSVSIGRPDGSGALRFNDAWSIQTVVSVTAGTYTYYALSQGNTVFDASAVNVIPKSLTAVFIPLRF